jgi:hypothetical protein
MEIMIKYYNKIKKGVSAKFIDADTTIQSTDDRVKSFFAPLPTQDENGVAVQYKRVYSEDGLPGIELVPGKTNDELLQIAKDAQISLISAAFKEAIKAGFTTNNILMDCDVQDMFLFEEGIKFTETLSGTELSVTGKDNIDTVVSIEDAKIMVQELKLNFFTLRTKKRTLQESIKGKLKVSTVETVIW